MRDIPQNPGADPTHWAPGKAAGPDGAGDAQPDHPDCCVGARGGIAFAVPISSAAAPRAQPGAGKATGCSAIPLQVPWHESIRHKDMSRGCHSFHHQKNLFPAKTSTFLLKMEELNTEPARGDQAPLHRRKAGSPHYSGLVKIKTEIKLQSQPSRALKCLPVYDPHEETGSLDLSCVRLAQRNAFETNPYFIAECHGNAPGI